MPHIDFFGIEVFGVVGIGGDDQRAALYHVHLFKCLEFFWIVCYQPYRADVKVFEYRLCHIVRPLILAKSQMKICFDGVQSVALAAVGMLCTVKVLDT